MGLKIPAVNRRRHCCVVKLQAVSWWYKDHAHCFLGCDAVWFVVLTFGGTSCLHVQPAVKMVAAVPSAMSLRVYNSTRSQIRESNDLIESLVLSVYKTRTAYSSTIRHTSAVIFVLSYWTMTS